MDEIITDWTVPGGGSGLTLMYFQDPPTLAAKRSALATLWAAIDSYLATTVSWTIRTSGRILDEATGTLTGFWNENTAHTGTGGGSGQVPNVAQALLQWRTGGIVRGRLVQGRTFVPGVAPSFVTNGNLAPAAITGMAAAAEAMADASVGFSVWSRPTGVGSDGSLHPVSSGSVWDELAALRKRRT